MIDDIREFVRELLASKGEADDIADDEALLSSGVLDSMDVLEIIGFLEERFDLDLAELPFDPGAFDTISGIARFCGEIDAQR